MQQVDVFSALANPIRREILIQLKKGPQNVTKISECFEVGRPAVSEHLQVLRRALLVKEEIRGRERFYHIDPRPLKEVQDWMNVFERY
ncbi:MAG: winged helix-turn-helix transcriptional regulator [Bdellovibrionales bacterium]|nr:winged helix-turn-helix transcriptional regulator [Bdellovibrionales bacterium]